MSKILKKEDYKFTTKILKNKKRNSKLNQKNKFKELNKINNYVDKSNVIGFSNLNLTSEENQFRNPLESINQSGSQCFYFVKFKAEYDYNLNEWNSFFNEGDAIVSFSPNNNICGYRIMNSVDSYINQSECSYDNGAPIKSGDVNGDGIVDILDIVEVLNFVLNNSNLTSCQFKSADMNNDGTINIQDVIRLCTIIMNSDGNRSERRIIQKVLNILLEKDNKNSRQITKKLQKIVSMLDEYVNEKSELYKNSRDMGTRDDMYIYIDVPVMGSDGNLNTSNYALINDIPYFKLYRHVSDNNYEIFNLNLNIDSYPFHNNKIHMINTIINEEITSVSRNINF